MTPHGRPPPALPHFSFLTFPSSSLLGENVNSSREGQGRLCVAFLQPPGGPCPEQLPLPLHSAPPLPSAQPLPCWGWVHLTFLLAKNSFHIAGTETQAESHRLSSVEASCGRKTGMAQSVSPPLALVSKQNTHPLDAQVSCISSSFSVFLCSACRALCFVFPAALPEVNQSKHLLKALRKDHPNSWLPVSEREHQRGPKQKVCLGWPV